MRIGAEFGTLPRVEEQQTLGGRYKLLNELGTGGMAVVWRARDEVLGRSVAVKLLAGRFADDPQSRARIRDEARTAATLSHPNIAQVYDFGEQNDGGSLLPYVVMELINGPTLQERVASGPLPPRTVFRICAEVAAALAAAHADGLVHRDIKPANVMMAPGGAKVVDFGIAASAGPGSPDDELLGTPAYLAPERLLHDAIEPASDVYALGVLLYRLLANEAPWSVDTTTQMLDAHVYLEPSPLPQLAGVPPVVTDLVHRCLAKDPGERPGAAEASAVLLAAADAPIEEAASKAEPKPAADPPRRDHKRLYLASAGAAVVVVIAVLVWLLNPVPPGDGEALAIAPTVSAGVSAAVGGTAARGAEPEPASNDQPGPGVQPDGRTAAPTVRTSGLPPAPADGLPPTEATPGGPTTAPGTAVPGPGPTTTQPAAEPEPARHRLVSDVGVVHAQCADPAGAELLDWQATAPYKVDKVVAGPAVAPNAIFKHGKSRVRMTVTCVAGIPTLATLPL